MYRYLKIYFSIPIIFRITTFCLSCPALLRFGVFIFCLLWGHSHSVIFVVLSPQVVGRLWGQSYSVLLGVLNLVGTVRLIRGGCIFCLPFGFFGCLGFFCLPWFFWLLPPLVPSALASLVFLSALVFLFVFGRFFPSLCVPSGGGCLFFVVFLEGLLLVVVVFFFCFSLVVFAYAFGFSF